MKIRIRIFTICFFCPLILLVSCSPNSPSPRVPKISLLIENITNIKRGSIYPLKGKIVLENTNDSTLVSFRAILKPTIETVIANERDVKILPGIFRIVNNYNSIKLDTFGISKSGSDSLYSQCRQLGNFWPVTFYEIFIQNLEQLFIPSKEIMLQKDCIHTIVVNNDAYPGLYNLQLIAMTTGCADTIDFQFTID